MNAYLREYILNLGLSDPIVDRVRTIANEMQQIIRSDFDDAFISDYIKDDGARDYESLFLFSEYYVCEAKSFFAADNFDITPLKNLVRYWKMVKQSYDLKNWNEKSRISLYFALEPGGASCTLKASKENCNHLRDMLIKHVQKNFFVKRP